NRSSFRTIEWSCRTNARSQISRRNSRNIERCAFMKGTPIVKREKATPHSFCGLEDSVAKSGTLGAETPAAALEDFIAWLIKNTSTDSQTNTSPARQTRKRRLGGGSIKSKLNASNTAARIRVESANCRCLTVR